MHHDQINDNKRIYSIDITRGVVMIIMALDHVRDLIHVQSINESPTNLATTTPALFFTRWITYLCAPTFVFLAGTSAYLSFVKKGLHPSRTFLLKRGLYLIILELLVVNFALYFDIRFHIVIFEVIATIGFGFIMLGLLLPVSPKTLAIAGLIIVFCHNLSPFIPLADTSVFKKYLMLLFSPGGLPFGGRVFVMAYPPLPWLGIMLIGFAAGKLFARTESLRKKLFIQIGLASLLLFVIIRFINVYGDSVPWGVQKDATFTFLSFMNVAKYPPSLVFCLVTLGIMFLLLAFTEGLSSKAARVISVYGKVPLFYFLVHFFLIHLLLVAILFLQGFHWSQIDFAAGNFGRTKELQSGLPLWAVYLVWVGVVIILYKPCRWYGKYKATHTHWWLKYL